MLSELRDVLDLILTGLNFTFSSHFFSSFSRFDWWNFHERNFFLSHLLSFCRSLSNLTAFTFTCARIKFKKSFLLFSLSSALNLIRCKLKSRRKKVLCRCRHREDIGIYMCVRFFSRFSRSLLTTAVRCALAESIELCRNGENSLNIFFLFNFFVFDSATRV